MQLAGFAGGWDGLEHSWWPHSYLVLQLGWLEELGLAGPSLLSIWPLFIQWFSMTFIMCWLDPRRVKTEDSRPLKA